MKKQVRKWLTLALAFALILGTVNYNPLAANATAVSTFEMGGSVTGNDSGGTVSNDVGGVAENVDTVSGDMAFEPGKAQMFSMVRNARSAVITKYYTFDQIPDGNKTNNGSGTESNGNLTASFSAQYGQITFGFPEGVDTSTLSTIELIGKDVSGLAIKLYTGEIANDFSGEAQAEYSSSLTVDSTKVTSAPVYFVIMNTSGGAKDYELYGIGLTAEQTGGSDEVPTGNKAVSLKYYTFDQIPDGNKTSAGSGTESNGNLTASFSANFGQIAFQFPEGVDTSTLSKIELIGEDVSGLAIKLYTGEIANDFSGEAQAAYSSSLTVDSTKVTSAPVYFVIMNTSGGAKDYELYGIGITAEQTGGSDEVPDGGEVDLTENITPAAEGEEDIRLTYKEGELTYAWGNCEREELENDRIKLTFNGAYQQIKLSLPETIDLSNCDSVTFAVSSQSSKIALKMFTDDSDTDGFWVKYDQQNADGLYTFDLSGNTEEINYIGIMVTLSDKQTCTLDGVLFDMKAVVEEDAATYTVTVNASALEKAWASTTATAELADDKRFKVTFGATNDEARLTLPVSIDLANCESITFNVKDQVGPVNLNFWLGESKKSNYYYNTGKTSYVLNPSGANENPPYKGEIDAIGVQVGGSSPEAGASVILESVVFTMKQTATDEADYEEDQVYGEPPVTGEVDPAINITPEATGDADLRYTHKEGGLTPQTSGDVTCTPQDIEKAALTFDKAWATIKFDLPGEIDLANCESVTFAISEQTVPLCLKLFDTDDNEIDVTQYDVTNKLSTIPLSGRTEIVKSVAIMLHEKDVTAVNTCVFDGVLFKMYDKDMVTHELTYTAEQLELGTVTAGAACDKVNGNYVLTFADLNKGAALKLPNIINMANCINIQVTVSGQTGPVNYYLDLDGSEKDHKYYNPPTESGVHTIVSALTSGGINELRIFCGGEEYIQGSCITVEKIVFTMKGSDDTDDFLTGEDADPEPPKVEATTDNITPVKADAVRLTAGELKVAAANVTEWSKTTADQIQITFSGGWSELKLTLPETINLLQCKSVTFAASEQTVPLSFKLYREGDLDNPVFAQYHLQNDEGIYTFDISSAEQVKYVGIMLHEEDVEVTQAVLANYCVFDGVVFEIDPDAATETYTVTYPANELTLKSSEAASCRLENGNWMIQFSNMDQNVNFKLPASVNLEKCVNIIFTVATQKGPMNFNVSLDNSKLKDYYYNTGNTVYTLEPGIAAKINEVGVQCGRENDAYVPGSFIELVSVSFLMKGTEPKDVPTDNNYTMDYLEVNTKSADVTEAVDENGAATITFPGKDDSITYEIPDSVDTNHLTSIQFLPALSGVRVEVLSAKGKVLASGTDGILQTNCNPDAKYIRLVSLADNTVLTLNSIKFNVDPDAFEAIVLNGRFDREDVSMWGAALWGSVDGVETTIAAKTSDTPITGDIYTYGEISRRSSPYVCFAQDVSDRTEHQTGYIYSFWAKLSDDYKDAPAELRTVEFSPYYIDANGENNYSMYRTGAYKQVLEPGVWTHFYGVVNLPSGAQGFVIRIVEQGTDYGQGTCLLGSYAVTDVFLTPTAPVPEPSWGGGGGGAGNRSDTITREATCEVTYALKDLSVDWASAKTSTENSSLKASFTNNYDEVRLKLPRVLDMSTCAYINISVPAQNVPIAVKLYWKGKQVDVAYYNDIQAVYLMVTEYDGMIDAIGIMSLATPNPAGAYALADSITFGLTQEPAPEEVSNSIVVNGDFTDKDMSDWSAALWGNGVTITQHTASKPIFGNTCTYATYSPRTSPYQCFAQDITGRVQQNETYTFSFWARLSNDYKGAPENQRVVQFAPYTVDKKGKEDYNPRLEGNYALVLEPGVWTYFEGTYKVTNDNPISKVVIRILEQGTQYGQGDCVMGSYDVAGVRMAKYIPDPPSIDEEVPNLKDAARETFGDDFIMGTAVTVNEMEDLGVEMLVNKHFNAVTIGNELKPDALFNYSNDAHTPLQTVTFNGEELEVPTLYYGRAEEILDTLKKWNEDHPEDPIKVRGHVLVWHSQTPEWFFRENYTVGQNADGSENYVTPEVMNLRLEWYIKTVLEHFTGEDSPYKDMFYGWDVVNEAVSNGGNGYRTEKVSLVEPLSQSTHSSNSSWWAVYQSNEFILKAFQYANQYAPAEVELYYNDYNECDNKKVVGIVKLLNDVKEAEGTRIDGMGMQGHYNMFNPSTADIERAVRAYAEVVGKVMYTEFDMKVSGDISNDTSREKEYLAQAERYRDIYQVLKRLDAEDSIEIGGFTVWGTVDKYSWLQSSSSVGGGADGTLTQCPLLFDSDYKVKPSYWALVDYTMVDPDWTGEEPVEEVKEEKEEMPETPGAQELPEPQPEAEPVADTNPVVEEQKKNSPAVSIAIAIGAVVIGAGAGFCFFKKKKKVTK